MTPEQQELQRRDELRLRLLQAVFRACSGMENRPVKLDEKFADSFKVEFSEVRAASTYLYRQGLLEMHGVGHHYRLTHEGILEAEESIRNPDRETDHFSQVVVNNVTNNFGNGNVIGSIQSGGTGNTATVNQTVTNNAKQVIQELRDKVASLPPEQHEEVHSVIDQIEAMVEKGPKALKAIELLITGLVTYFPSAVPWLTSQAQLIARAFGG